MLHIHSPEQEHDDAWIIGNVKSLTILRDAIDKALNAADGVAFAEDLFCGDGEGFNCWVLKVQDETFQDLRMPYTDNIYDRGGTLRPEHVLPKGRYMAEYNRQAEEYKKSKLKK